MNIESHILDALDFLLEHEVPLDHLHDAITEQAQLMLGMSTDATD